MRRDLRKLNPINTVELLSDMLEVVLPMQRIADSPIPIK